MPEETFYDAIRKELSEINGVKIKSQMRFPGKNIPLLQARELGEIVIGYETRQKKYLFGLIKTESPLASLDDVQRVLEQNPEIGEPFDATNEHLIYTRLIPGIGQTQISDRIVVGESPLMI